MATEKRLIDANALVKAIRFEHDCIMQDPEVSNQMKWRESVCYQRSMRAIEKAPIVYAVEVVRLNALKSLINGEWVDCKLVEEAFGIDFATGLKMFAFSRTAEWNPAPLNGQKITTKFKLKNAVVHGRWEPVDHDGSWRVDMCSICHKRMHYVDYDQPYQYCPNCGAKMDLKGE